MVDAGWWIEDDVGFLILDFGFIQNSKFRRPCGVCVSMIEVHIRTEDLCIDLSGFFGGFKKHERKQWGGFQLFC
jgi:hypothetical protein